MQVIGYAATSPHSAIEEYFYDPGPLGSTEVDIAVTHCGVCHTDVGMIDDEFGISQYPLVAGHEVVGVVTAIGDDVDPDRLHIGQRVGVGAFAGACMNCEFCLTGRHGLCPRRDDTVMRGHRGGFASHLRASNWHFVYPIPAAMRSEVAGPLFCAGATVFAPLLHYGVRPTDRVAVVGVGGLGHLAVQFLNKWGCEVTAISSSPDKEQQAKKFGASHFIATRGTDELAKAAGTFDFIMSTVSADLPWDEYLAALRPQGTLCVLGVPDGAFAFQPMALLPAEKSVRGGLPGAPVETAQMLAFAARHHIEPLVETFPIAEIDQALAHVRQGKAHYRAVLVA